MNINWKLAPLWVGLCALCIGGRAAWADVKLTLDVTISSGSAASTQHTVRMFVQGDEIRVEGDPSPDGVSIYDLKSGHVYRLDARNKTYTVEALRESQRSIADQIAGPEIKSTHVKLVARGDAREFAGIVAHALSMSGHAESDPDTNTRAGPAPMSGGAGGGGLRTPMGYGIPTGPGSSGDDNSPDPRITLHLEGQYWMAPDPSEAPTHLREAFDTLRHNLPAVRLLYTISLPHARLSNLILEALLRQVSDPTLQFPLGSRITRSAPDPEQSLDAPEKEKPLEIITTAVTSIESTPLDRMLFIVPAEFRQGDN